MKLPEHVALSYLLSQVAVASTHGPTGTFLMIVAGLLPDVDGISLLGGWSVYRKYHRTIGHSLLVTLAGPALVTWIGTAILLLPVPGLLWIWLQIAVLAHIVSDACFYRWPVKLLWPVSNRSWGLGWVTWNDLGPTLVLYGGVLLTMLLPRHASLLTVIVLGVLALYVGWRAWWPRAYDGWAGWLAGGWIFGKSRVWLWLTGDFMT